MSRLTYGTLPVGPEPGVQLYCPRCGLEYSAQRSDYHLESPIASPRCISCRNPLKLVRVVMMREPVTPEQAESREL